MTLNPYLNRFISVKHLNRAMSWNAWDISMALFPVLRVFWQNNMASAGKYLFKTPGNAISETLNFKISLDASALKNLCLWCKFQSHLLFIIGLLLKNVLTALNTGAYKVSVHKFPGYVQSPRFGNIFCQKCGCSQELIFNTNYWYTPLTPALCARLREMSVLKRVN